MRPRPSAPAAGLLFTASLLIMVGCQDTGQSPPARPEPPPPDQPEGSRVAPLDLIYLCGNKFLVTNALPSALRVEYRVVGTNEVGSLNLEAGPGGDPGYSETELETSRGGDVELYLDEVRVARGSNDALACGPEAVASTAGIAGVPASVGEWSQPFDWPVIAVHLSLLPDGKVLSWGEAGEPQVWDPVGGSFQVVPVPTEMFCAGHTLLPDGTMLVIGGHQSDTHGLPDVNLFDRTAVSWSSGARMARGRWYPTALTLPNGEALALAGTDLSGANVQVPEVWTGAGWRALTGAKKGLPYYPRSFVAPNGRVFVAGERPTTYYLSTSGTGSWSTVGDRLFSNRSYGAAAMYLPGKILYAGGGRTTRTAEIIDLNQSAPVWRWTGSMQFARRNLNATLLPTGEVLVTGGTAGTENNDESKAVFAAEVWNPTSGVWTQLASGSVVRGYHSTAVLLPDGRVLVAGNGDSERASDQRSAELYSPPYLFKGDRPVIGSSPGTAGYGKTFFLETAEPSSVSKVSLIRLGSTTHANNMNQRYSRLSFTVTSDGLNVKVPANRNLTPPGHYLLFLVNGAGVPSTGNVIRLM